ncbi:hypothetical protein RHGRI_004031 [Rhododendron griersonianum]|uniref:Uncharacterized protein n=1 Tax=Rhododendron griersonianum TaxID=479676 RepID=A0AAV6L8A2_9ERIC|nr:hypothetical protein RHGRI_004029 [Rhododendron griersonianum]KAG5560871.1 hypothetical protein RHGRI_004031 [Rhododendron griersonianum]
MGKTNPITNFFVKKKDANSEAESSLPSSNVDDQISLPIPIIDPPNVENPTQKTQITEINEVEVNSLERDPGKPTCLRKNLMRGSMSNWFTFWRIYGIVSCPWMFAEKVEKERGTNECDLADAVDQEDIAKLSDAVKELNSMRLMTQLICARYSFLLPFYDPWAACFDRYDMDVTYSYSCRQDDSIILEKEKGQYDGFYIDLRMCHKLRKLEDNNEVKLGTVHDSVKDSIVDEVHRFGRSMLDLGLKPLPLLVDVGISMSQLPGESEDEGIARAMTEMDVFDWVPATKASIGGLEEVAFDGLWSVKECKRCSKTLAVGKLAC